MKASSSNNNATSTSKAPEEKAEDVVTEKIEAVNTEAAKDEEAEVESGVPNEEDAKAKADDVSASDENAENDFVSYEIPAFGFNPYTETYTDKRVAASTGEGLPAQPQKPVILSAKGLCKVYGTDEGKTIALDGVDLELYEGELLVILGSSGCGKSTLLNLLGGMDRPTQGSITVHGENITEFSDARLTDYRKQEIGFVFQSFNLMQELTARENVELTANTAENEQAVEQAFELVGLTEKMSKYPSQLSGGEQQRVSIARALAKQSILLLCDEPTGALDSETGKQVLERLEALARIEGKTVVIVTHTQEIAQIADRVIHVRNGKIEEEVINEQPKSVQDIEW